MTSHLVKRITYRGNNVGIVMQNENGPCPLIAICNILLLRMRISIHPDIGCLGFEDLVAMLKQFMVDEVERRGQTDDPNTAFLMNEALELLPVLEHGMDLNIKFSGIDACEASTGLACFDYFRIRVVHGWLPPEEEAYSAVVKNSSYNAVTEMIILKNEEESKESPDPAVIERGELAQKWLAESAGQLTYTGLIELSSKLSENELCVLFRNNHFSTLTKVEGRLYSLLTDIGYQDVSEAVWESLADVDGDMKISNANFAPPTDLGRQGNVLGAYRDAPLPAPAHPEGLSQAEQEQLDFQYAQALVHQDMKVQQERDQYRRARQQQQQQQYRGKPAPKQAVYRQQPPAPQPRPKKSDKSCVIC